MHTLFRSCLIILILFFILTPKSLYAQQTGYLAIIPTFHDRLGTPGYESPLQLKQQRFVLFVYPNAVAVYCEADFFNSGIDTINMELSLPSTGHDENGDEPFGRISNGILSVQLWVEDEQVEPQIINDGNTEWYTIQTQFEPDKIREVKALFWAQTSLTNVDSLPGLDTTIIKDGKCAFLVNLAHMAIWKDVIESLNVIAVLKDNVLQNLDTANLAPLTYELEDSTLVWSYTDIEPTEDDNIYVPYTVSGEQNSRYNTMAKLSEFIVKNAYDQLLSYYDQLYEE